MSRKTKSVAITGAGNYLGTGIIKRLIEHKHFRKIVVIGQHEPKISHPKVIFYKVDLTNPNAHLLLATILKNEKVSTFLHLIFSYTLSHNRTLAHELEAIGTMHILDACSDAGVRKVIVRSTTAIYGAKPGNPAFLREDRPIKEQEQGTIIRDKVEMERQLLQYANHNANCCVTILRNCTSLGPTAINYLSRLLLNKKVLKVAGFDPIMQFVHEKDLFKAYMIALEEDHPGVFNIVGKGVVRYSQAIKRMKSKSGSLPESLLKPSTRLFWALHLFDIPPAYLDYLKYTWVADGSKAVRELNFIPEFDCFQALDDARRSRKQKRDRG